MFILCLRLLFFYSIFPCFKHSTCGSQPPRWRPTAMTAGIHSLLSSPILNHAWPLWPVAYCEKDGVWLLNLGYKYIQASTFLSLGLTAVEELSCGVVRTLKLSWNEVHEGRNCGLPPATRTNFPAMGVSHPSASVELPDDCNSAWHLAYSHTTDPKVTLPTKPRLDSCPIETVTDNKCLLLF